MASEATRGTDSSFQGEDLLKQLEEDYKELQSLAQSLITERSNLEGELRSLKKRANRLEESVRILQSPPLIIGTLQDILDDENAIVRSSNGTVFQVTYNSRIEPSKLKPGTRVALNQDSLSIIEVLHDAWDPMVSGAEMVEAPDIMYTDVAGLSEQVELVRESVELPLTKPELFTKVGIEPPKGCLLYTSPSPRD